MLPWMSYETPVPESLSNKIAGGLWHRCFPVNFTKFLKRPVAAFVYNAFFYYVYNLFRSAYKVSSKNYRKKSPLLIADSSCSEIGKEWIESVEKLLEK